MANKAKDSRIRLSSFCEDSLDREILPSFPSIRAKALQTLYGLENQSSSLRDKSPKGSVDEPIRPLVDLINHHPSFATLSSCSGRISLFDPNHCQRQATESEEEQQVEGNSQEEQANNNVSSGKGVGGWLLVSHETIQPEILLRALSDHQNRQCNENHLQDKRPSSSMLSLRFEPMLLHVAAANLERGQQLLQLALGLGYRESGLVVTAHRVTVAVRSYSLALTVPLAAADNESPWRLSDAYLRAFVHEANARFETNQQRIQGLFHAFQKQFLRRKPVHVDIHPILEESSRPRDLCLWGHASVLWDRSDADVSSELFVFGGYGRGPGASKSKGPSRSNKVYRLVSDNKDESGETWGSEWQSVEFDICLEGTNDWCGLEAVPCEFTAREGARAILWEQEEAAAALLFGGRTSPANPLGDLLLFDCVARVFLKPVDVRGSSPSPRWGHSWTNVAPSAHEHDSSCRDIALLAGGRDETQVFSDFYLLSCQTNGDTDNNGDDEPRKHLLWTQIDFDPSPPPCPRFHHTVLYETQQEQQGLVILHGGLSSATHVLGIRDDGDDGCGDLLVLGTNQIHTLAKPSDAAIQPMFGQASCALRLEDQTVFVCLGGLSVYNDDGEAEKETNKNAPVQCVSLAWSENEALDSHHPYALQMVSARVSGPANFGSLVHHTCHATALSSGVDHHYHHILVVGGGVQGFAFGPQYASSMLLRVQITQGEDTDRPRTRVGAQSNNKITAPSKTTSSPHKTTIDNNDNTNENEDKNRVVFVLKQHAKSLRTHLEHEGILDKRFRMAPAETTATAGEVDAPQPQIAVPVTAALPPSAEWRALVQGEGYQRMPPSTGTFAAKRK